MNTSKVNLVKVIPFEHNKDLKVGHMRCDFTQGKLANSWFPADKFDSLSKEERSEIQEVVNDIMNNHFPTFDDVVEGCNGNEGYGNETNYFAQVNDFNYWVRLNPVESDYSMYIMVYTKS